MFCHPSAFLLPRAAISKTPTRLVRAACCRCRTVDLQLARSTAMPHLNTEAKHHILLEYAPHDAARSFAALAARHAIAGGSGTVARWHQRWDGTPASLEEQPRAGRPRVLSRAQVSRHVRTPILAANRAHRAIHYTDVLPRVRAATGRQISLRSVQRYGKEELGARQRRGQKRTADESQCTAACERDTPLPHAECVG